MVTAFYEVMSETDTSGSYRSAPDTAGPWAADLQHGGPPTALLVHAAERAAMLACGRSDLVAVRLAAEFVRAVPVSDLVVTSQIVREARTAVLVEAALASGDRTCLSARVWLIRDADTSHIAAARTGSAGEPPVGQGLGASFPYAEQIEWRVLSGGLRAPGPGAVWARPRGALIDGRALTGLQRAALIGDSASGISSELDWNEWSFVNVDLDVHLARPMIGEWLLMDAATQLGPNGSALARGALSDAHGPLGATLQTLVLSPHRR